MEGIGGMNGSQKSEGESALCRDAATLWTFNGGVRVIYWRRECEPGHLEQADVRGRRAGGRRGFVADRDVLSAGHSGKRADGGANFKT